MKIIAIILLITNILLLPNTKGEEYPIDMSEDILSEGISDYSL